MTYHRCLLGFKFKKPDIVQIEITKKDSLEDILKMSFQKGSIESPPFPKWMPEILNTRFHDLSDIVDEMWESQFSWSPYPICVIGKTYPIDMTEDEISQIAKFLT